jgi:hypothetical protein
VELIQAGGETLLYVIHKLINYIWNKEELPDQWKESIKTKKNKLNSMSSVHERTTPTEQWSLVDEVNANFCG